MTTNIEGQSNYRTIEDLQANLDRETFWRVHRSYLVNINRIKEVVPWFKSSYPAPHGRQEAHRGPGEPGSDQTAAGAAEAVAETASAATGSGQTPGRARRVEEKITPPLGAKKARPLPMVWPVAGESGALSERAEWASNACTSCCPLLELK